MILEHAATRTKPRIAFQEERTSLSKRIAAVLPAFCMYRLTSAAGAWDMWWQPYSLKADLQCVKGKRPCRIEGQSVVGGREGGGSESARVQMHSTAVSKERLL